MAANLVKPPGQPIIITSPSNPRWLQMAQQQSMAPLPPPTPKITVLDMLLGSGLSLLTGALLGVADSELKDGLDVNNVALDGVLAGFLLPSAVMFNSPISASVGNSCLTVYGMRKTRTLLAGLKEKAHAMRESSTEESKEEEKKEDPITAASEQL